MHHILNGIFNYRLMVKGREMNTLPMLLQGGMTQYTLPSETQTMHAAINFRQQHSKHLTIQIQNI